jgi:hypothetical protein
VRSKGSEEAVSQLHPRGRHPDQSGVDKGGQVVDRVGPACRFWVLPADLAQQIEGTDADVPGHKRDRMEKAVRRRGEMVDAPRDRGDKAVRAVVSPSGPDAAPHPVDDILDPHRA